MDVRLDSGRRTRRASSSPEETNLERRSRFLAREEIISGDWLHCQRWRGDRGKGQCTFLTSYRTTDDRPSQQDFSLGLTAASIAQVFWLAAPSARRSDMRPSFALVEGGSETRKAGCCWLDLDSACLSGAAFSEVMPSSRTTSCAGSTVSSEEPKIGVRLLPNVLT